MKPLLAICRYLVGVLFIFSGLIKLNDPVGTQIKMEEYFEVFAHDFAPFFEHFIPLALAIAIIMCVAEVVMGIALLINYRPKFTTTALLVLIVFFTFLTFYSAYFNKVTDCGCFGDAIKLTPWQSFSKDVVLTVLIGFLFAFRGRMHSSLPYKTGNIIVGSSLALCSFMAWFAIAHLPFIDFRPYKVGNNIPALMTLPPGAKPDVYVINYTMKNAVSGQVKKVTDKEYMDTEIWKDTTWQITETGQPELVQKGDKAKITDYAVADINGNDLTKQSFTGNKLFIIVQNADKVNKASFTGINNLVANLQKQYGSLVEVWVLTNNGYETMEALRHEVQLGVPYFFTDATVLKTIMRSNPGLWLLKDGTVKGKWHYNDTPGAQEVALLVK